MIDDGELSSSRAWEPLFEISVGVVRKNDSLPLTPGQRISLRETRSILANLWLLPKDLYQPLLPCCLLQMTFVASAACHI